MSNVIQFIERLGRSPGRRLAAAYAVSVESLGLNPPEQRALLDRDLKALRDLLGARENMRCMITTPDD